VFLQADKAGAAPSADSPTVTGPIAGTPFLMGTNFALSQVGYEQSEFFVSGNAHSYTTSTPLSTDGKWNTITANPTTAPYETRALVRRPIDPTKFNGTVVVEWLNVTGGLDYPSDWVQYHTELVRDGFAWVGISAQAAGVNQLKCKAVSLPTCVAPGDPARYGSLSHPGDSYSYDIFSQAAQATRSNSALMLDGLTPSKVLATGHSQSAGRLVTYIDAVDPLVHEFDGFFVHGRSALGAALSQTPLPAITPPLPNTMIRDDVGVPVFVLESETDMSRSSLWERQPNAPNIRLREIAGGSHFDYYALFQGPNDIGDGSAGVANMAAEQDPPTDTMGAGTCNIGVNTGGTHWALNAAIYELNQWVVNGTAPTSAYVNVSTRPGTTPVGFELDSLGNATGGVRTPQVDTPIAKLSGVGNSPLPNCQLFGTTTPFTAAQIKSLYKNHGQFVSQWAQATQNDVKRGFLLPADVDELIGSAGSSTIAK
jgi:hypothetical protein